MKRFFSMTLPRLVLGAVFLLSAVDGFYFIFTGGRIIHPPTSARGEEFEAALIASGFFWPLLKTVNLIGAICLLTNRAPAFGFALIVPVITVIVGFHVFLNPQGLPVAAILVVCSLLLLRAYWPQYAGLFEPERA